MKYDLMIIFVSKDKTPIYQPKIDEKQTNYDVIFIDFDNLGKIREY